MFEGAPEVVRIDITGRCNLRCSHCQASMFLGQRSSELRTADWVRIIDELSDEGCIDLGILGGEPLLRRDIFDIISHARSRGIRCLITTNGDLLDEDSAKKLLIDLNCAVSVSFDGATPESHDMIRGKGSFTRARNAASLLSKIKAQSGGARIGLSFVVHAGNIETCESIVDFSMPFNPDYVSVAEIHDGGRAAENWSSLAVDKIRLLNACVRLAKRVMYFGAANKFRMDFFTNKVRQWLLDIHSIDYPQTVRMDPGGFREAYIQHDGLMFPSQQCSTMRPEILAGAAARGIVFSDNNLRINSVRNIWRSMAFKKYRELSASKAHIYAYDPCSTCFFSTNLCQPSIGPFLRGECLPQALCSLSNDDLVAADGSIK